MRHSRGDAIAGMTIVIGSCLRVDDTNGFYFARLFYSQGIFLRFDDTALHRTAVMMYRTTEIIFFAPPERLSNEAGTALRQVLRKSKESYVETG